MFRLETKKDVRMVSVTFRRNSPRLSEDTIAAKKHFLIFFKKIYLPVFATLRETLEDSIINF